MRSISTDQTNEKKNTWEKLPTFSTILSLENICFRSSEQITIISNSKFAQPAHVYCAIGGWLTSINDLNWVPTANIQFNTHSRFTSIFAKTLEPFEALSQHLPSEIRLAFTIITSNSQKKHERHHHTWYWMVNSQITVSPFTIYA